MILLTRDQLIDINARIIKKYSSKEFLGVRDSKALDMLIKAPQSTFFGEELYPTVFDEAAAAIQDLQTEAEQAVEEGVQTAEEISDMAAKYSLYVFVGLLIAMFVTAFAGLAGAKTYLEAQEDNAAIK